MIKLRVTRNIYKNKINNKNKNKAQQIYKNVLSMEIQLKSSGNQ